ncbi:hypothetical protein RQP46_000971 [Phenoliferia psychrophenolica]
MIRAARLHPSLASHLLRRPLSTAAAASSSPHAPPPAAGTGTNTISASEIAHFSSLAAHWWDPTGEFALLHRMNPARVQFVRDSILRTEELGGGARWLEGRSVLDVGCGGGIFAEALSRLGASTLAIDASPVNIRVAQSHAALDPSFVSPSPSPSSSLSPSLPPRRSNSLEYRHTAAENLVKEGQQFDVVCSMEVLEHVEDAHGFLDCLSDLTKPGGLLLLSTINRTPLSHLLSITMAEDILRLVTPGTHTYSKFVKPEELQTYFDAKGWYSMERRGCPYDPIKGGWRLMGQGDLGGLGEMGNYFAGVRKPL